MVSAVISMTRAFYNEWLMSEVVDNFHIDDIEAMLSCEDQFDWEVQEFHHIHDFDLERVHFDICMLRAQKGKNQVKVTFDEQAIEYVLHPLALTYQIEKWQDWGREGSGFVRSGWLILQNLWDAIEGTDLEKAIRAQVVADRKMTCDMLSEMRRKMG